MREKKWSKGPWKIGAIESGRFAVDDRDGEEVTGWIEEYDAHLIKTAPELVESLEGLIRMHRERFGLDGAYDNEIRTAEAILTKAYGENEEDFESTFERLVEHDLENRVYEAGRSLYDEDSMDGEK